MKSQPQYKSFATMKRAEGQVHVKRRDLGVHKDGRRLRLDMMFYHQRNCSRRKLCPHAVAPANEVKASDEEKRDVNW